MRQTATENTDEKAIHPFGQLVKVNFGKKVISEEGLEAHAGEGRGGWGESPKYRGQCRQSCVV